VAFVAISLVYLLCHFLLYRLVFRNSRWLAFEGPVFLFHVGSFALMMLVGGICLAAVPGVRLPHVALALACHLIYSLSFLEAWALSDGSYSFATLEVLAAARAPQPIILDRLAGLASQKRAARLSGLVRGGQVSNVEGECKLTARGLRTAALLDALARLCNLRMTA
jgi:hypothetical protein